MLTNGIPMDHLSALVRERQERLLAEAAAERLAGSARPDGPTAAPWVVRLLRALWEPGHAPARRTGRLADRPRPPDEHDLRDGRGLHDAHEARDLRA